MKTQNKPQEEMNVFVYLATLPDAKQRRLLGLPLLPKPRLKRGKTKKEKKS